MSTATRALAAPTVILLCLVALSSGSRSVSASSTYTFSWNGTPSSPQPWNPQTGFDLVKHDRDFTVTYSQPYSFQAMHGTDCGPFQGFGVGGTHLAQTYDDLAFVCNNHFMTGINGQGYGEITFTPAQLLDWSAGTATATWKVDTLRTSCRDWLSYNLMPFADNLMLTDGIGVDLYDEPRNEVLLSYGASCAQNFQGTDIRDFAGTPIPGPGGAVDDVVDTTSMVASRVRQAFELDVSSTHVRFGMPAPIDDSTGAVLPPKWFVDGDLASPLPYTQAVLQFEQHSYTPDKQCTPTTTFCAADTWHWSDINYSSAVPFTVLRADKFQVAGGHVTDGVPDTVVLPAPAPANSYLRFEAVAAVGTLRFTTDGGATWTTPGHQQLSQKDPSGALVDNQAQEFFWPIAAGATTIRFDAGDTYWTWNAIRNISVWSTGSPVVLPTPTPTPSPTPTATPSPTPTPAPTPTPTSSPTPTPTPTPSPTPKHRCRLFFCS